VAIFISQPANAAPIQAVFTGTVASTEGTVDTAGIFGAPGGDLTGSSYTATFIYDLVSLGPVISGSNQFASYVYSNSVMSAAVTMNDHTVTIISFAVPGDVTSALWNSPGQMWGKSFSATASDTETIGNTSYLSLLSDQVFSDQIPLLTVDTPFSSDNANYSRTGEEFSGSLLLGAFGGASEYQEIFDLLSSNVVVSPLVAASVPEPWTAATFGASLIGLGLLRRRKVARAPGSI
jgi:hypothetical protein